MRFQELDYKKLASHLLMLVPISFKLHHKKVEFCT